MRERRSQITLSLRPGYTLHTIRSLAEGAVGCGDSSAPILRQHAAPHIAMERRMRPVAHPGCQTVLDWIEMDVIDVPRKVRFITDRVLPESSLPESIFSAAVLPERQSSGDDLPAK